MGTDLWGEAKQAEERLIEAEHRAEVARGEFYAALRRLHLDGASLRELAGAFGLSHQRVHQIVEAGGRSRRWRRRRGPCSDAVCSFCGREHSHGRTLVAGPGVHICEGCVGVVSGVVDTVVQEARPEGPSAPSLTGTGASGAAFAASVAIG